MASCTTPPPLPPPPMTGPPLYGAGGTQSPNYPPADPRGVKPGETPPRIVRDTSENVNIAPPDSRTPTIPPVTDTPPTTNPNPTAPNPPPTTNPEPTKPPPAVREDLPFGIPVVGKKDMVYSPYAPEKGQVDVAGFKRGTRVECPYTKKHFRVP